MAEEVDRELSLFSDPDKLVSDLNACVRFNIPPELSKLLVARCAEIAAGRAWDRDGNQVHARAREITAATRAVIAMERINQMEKDRFANLMGIAAQIQAAKESELRTARMREERESGHDFVLRIAAECKQTLQAIQREEGGPAVAGVVGDVRADIVGPSWDDVSGEA